MTTGRRREDLAASVRPRLRPTRRGMRGRWRRQLLPTGTFQRRTLALMVVFALVIGGAVTKLVSIQVLHAEDYAMRSADQRDEFRTLPAQRGRLYDRSGEVLAASVMAASVWADPRAFTSQPGPDGTPLPPAQDPGEAAVALAPLLGVEAAAIRERLTRTADFIWLARQLDAGVGDAVRDLGLHGIGVNPEPRRTYPGGSLAAQVLGTTDVDSVGLGGMELRHDARLVGQPGWLAFEQSRDGSVIPSGTREVQSPVPGTDVVLTLDRQLQYTAERVAAETVAATGAVGASIVVLEVGSGEVLAMASAPTVDLNDRASMSEALLRNRAVTDNFEPGSVQKALTAAAALEEGVVTPETVLEVPDSLAVGSKVFTDAYDHPTEEWTFAEVMERSSNVGTIMVAQDLGPERLADWLTRFGYGRPTEVGFPGEAAGSVRPVEEWWGTSLPTVAIGQGVSVTLLQAANAYATLANDGVAVQPHLVRGTVGADGVLQPITEPSSHRVTSAATAAQVRAMLHRVVSGEHGTGKRAAITGHDVAGKTGTARKPLTDGRGYAGAYIASFVGMAPADDPELVVAVMVDEPTPIYGGVVAAPAFREVMAEALRRQHVESQLAGPSLENALAEAARARAAAERVAAERETARRAREAAGATASAEAAPAAQE